MDENPWRTLGSRVIYANSWVRLREDAVIRPDGSEGIYGVLEISPAVGIVALSDDDQVALVTQWRYTLGKMSTELPTGGSHASDPDLLAAAKRELREETGLSASTWRELGTIDSCNGVTNDVGHMFLATGLAAGPDAQDPEEQLVLTWMPFDRAVTGVLAGEITEALSIAAILKVELLRRRGELTAGPSWRSRRSRGA